MFVSSWIQRNDFSDCVLVRYEHKNAMKEVATGGQEAQESQNHSHVDISQQQEKSKRNLKADIQQMELDNADSVGAIRYICTHYFTDQKLYISLCFVTV